MNVLWTHGGSADMASYRYRVAIPSQHVKAHGVNVTDEGDIVVFSKPGPETPAHMRICGDVPTVVDICDDHFARWSHYAEACQLATRITCPTPVMADRIKEATGKEATVIADPYEMEKGEPHGAGNAFVWFGHEVNLPSLQKLFPMFDGIDLQIVTGPNTIVPHRRWSLPALQDALSHANVALLPTQPGHEYKSANRLINALRAGCFALCERHPAYAEFAPFVWVGDVHGGVQWLRAFQDEVNDRIAEAQDHIEQHYSPQIIGKQWADLFASI